MFCDAFLFVFFFFWSGEILYDVVWSEHLIHQAQNNEGSFFSEIATYIYARGLFTKMRPNTATT